jgi:hypothetical protein
MVPTAFAQPGKLGTAPDIPVPTGLLSNPPLTTTFVGVGGCVVVVVVVDVVVVADVVVDVVVGGDLLNGLAAC